MADMEFNEFQQLDDAMLDLKLTPKDLQLPIPRFFRDESAKLLDERERMLEAFNARILDYSMNMEENAISRADAILCIQTNERGRQGCLRAKFIREIRIQAEREKLFDKTETEIDVSEAALTIQRV
jgi:hypothetical protein